MSLPITVSKASEIGALGAAIGAGCGVKLFTDYEAGIAAMTEPDRVYQPDFDRNQMYNTCYQAWQDLGKRMQGFWTTLT